MNYTFEEFYMSTADDEKNYFTEVAGESPFPRPERAPLQPGTYGVRDGKLYLITLGASPVRSKPLNKA